MYDLSKVPYAREESIFTLRKDNKESSKNSTKIRSQNNKSDVLR